MWNPAIIPTDKISIDLFEKLFQGTIPAILVPSFYSSSECKEIVSQLTSCTLNSSLVGPFLMSYTTDKKRYFEQSKEFSYIFKKIFSKTEDPHSRISKLFQSAFTSFSISVASEDDQNYSPYIFRIHKNGKSIPLHKDNVKYEGIEYNVSHISKQFSCILHLQEPLDGGILIIYQRQWSREDERFREIDFGYSKKISSNHQRCKIGNLDSGDLVIINPTFYHKVTTVHGNLDRITLGMFVGVNDSKSIVCWA